jgi:aryl-alcohol dehydrogenase-like predicted oxidoreductase
MTSPLPSELRPVRREFLEPSDRLERLGLHPSPVAFGLAGIGGAWGPVDPGLARETLRQAMELGVTVFDVAPSYGAAESLLGAALAGWPGPRPVISTKVGRLPGRDGLEVKFDYSSAGLRASLERSLATLGVPQVDLLFLHEPGFVPVAERARVADVLRQLQADGLARRLGLAGGMGAEWDGYVETGAFDVVMLFRRLDACIFDGLVDDVPRVSRAGLATYGASPLHMGLLGSRYEEFLRDPPDWVWAGPRERAVRLQALAEKRGLTLPQLAHGFMFSVGEVDRVVIGARTPAELLDAWAAWRAGPLPGELFDEICAAQ